MAGHLATRVIVERMFRFGTSSNSSGKPQAARVLSDCKASRTTSGDKELTLQSYDNK